MKIFCIGKFWFWVMLLFFGFASCKKEKETSTPEVYINYPDSLMYGKNILNMKDSAIISQVESFEMTASLAKDAKLEILLTNLSDPTINPMIWGFSVAIQGWNIGVYNNLNKIQKVSSTSSGTLSAKVAFLANKKRGIMRLDFYENGATISKTKYLFWE
jgi:hypothetical protein